MTSAKDLCTEMKMVAGEFFTLRPPVNLATRFATLCSYHDHCSTTARS